MKQQLLSLLLLLVPQSHSFAPSFLTTTTRPTITTHLPMASTSITEGNGGGVVITGSANGVGFAYAGEFLKRGYDVVISDVKDCSAALAALQKRYPDTGGNIYATQCDVSDSESVMRLGEFAKEKMGKIGYWINNAGINGGRRALTEVPFKEVELVVKVNLLGILYGTKVAMDIMAEQQGFTGHIFNTVGSGVKGGGTPGYATYGATKRGLPQLTASLVAELDNGVQGYEKTNTPGKIMVHSLSPGMVFTKLLLDNSTPELRKFPFGVLAAQPEEVAADLVPKILATTGQGGSVEFLTTDRILTKFFERFVLQKKSEYIDDDGNVIKTPGEEYDASKCQNVASGLKSSQKLCYQKSS